MEVVLQDCRMCRKRFEPPFLAGTICRGCRHRLFQARPYLAEGEDLLLQAVLGYRLEPRDLRSYLNCFVADLESAVRHFTPACSYGPGTRRDIERLRDKLRGLYAKVRIADKPAGPLRPPRLPAGVADHVPET